MNDPIQRIATLFGRRNTTAWSEKEVRRYKVLVKDGYLTNEDMDLIERYYAFQRRKGDKGIHRRDLYTFLNNFPGELDRARAWQNEKVIRIKRYADYGLMPDGGKPCCDEERQRIREVARMELAKFKTQFNR